MTERSGATEALDSWPADAEVLFLADTQNRVERSIVTEWLSNAQSRGAVSPRAEIVHVSLEHQGQSDERGLRAALGRSDAAVLVPLRVAWLPERDLSRAAPRLRDLVIGDPRHPTPHVARLIQLRNPDGYQCLVGASADLGELRRRHTELAGASAKQAGGVTDVERLHDFVLRQAAIALDVAERRLRGRRYKVPRAVNEGIENSPSYAGDLGELAAGLHRPVREVRHEARDYLREMVATPSVFFIDWMGSLTRRITSLGYSKVVTDAANVERARSIVSDHPTAFLWTHKSHMDGIALLSVMYDSDFPAPHSLGGLNMALGPLGYVGQRSGIIYIRRSFTDNAVYKFALQQYLGFLMSKRFPFSWAFEGTRSRNGKLGPPRYGLLKYVIDAAHVTHTENLHLIPVCINYDLIGETSEYAREESGIPKESESLSWFMGYLRRLRAPMGNIYVDFAEPVVLEGPAPRADRELLASVAFEVARRANDQVPVTLPSLMCTALLGAAPRALTYAELDRSMRELLEWLRARDVRLAESFVANDVAQLEQIAENTFAGGVVERVTAGAETLFAIADGEYPAASYYRNTIIHYFVNKALCEVALERVADHPPQAREAGFWEEIRWLRDATKFEFFHTPSDDFAAAVDAELSITDPAWREVLSGSPGEVRDFLGRLGPLVSHAVLLPFIEGYWLVSRAVAETAPDAQTSESAIVARAIQLGQSSLKQHRISSQASIGKAVFKGAYAFLGHAGLLEAEAPTLVEDRQAMVARLEDVVVRVRRVAAMAHADLFATR